MRRCFSPHSMRHAVHAPLFLTPAPFHATRRPARLYASASTPPHSSLYMQHGVPLRLSPDRKALFHALSRPSLPHTHNKKRGAVFRTPVSNPPVLPAFSASVLHSMPQLQPRRSIRRNPTPGNLLAAGFRVLPAAYAYLRLASGIASGALVSCFTFSVTGL